MTQRNRSRDARTGRRRLIKLLAATGALAGGLSITAQVPAAEPPRDVRDVTVARLGSVCRVLGVQRRVVGEPRAFRIQPCQALAPIVEASSEPSSTPDSSVAADSAELVGTGAGEAESVGPTENEASVRLLRPVPDAVHEPSGASTADAFSPFRFAPSAHATDTASAGQHGSSTSFDEGDRAADRSPSSPTSPRADAPTLDNSNSGVVPDGANPERVTPPDVAPTQTGPPPGAAPEDATSGLVPVVGRRTARATSTSQSPQVDPLFEVIPESGEMSVAFQESKMLRLREPVGKVAVVDPTICEVVQFSPREICLLGKSPGATNITFWVGQSSGRPATYRVTVEADPRTRELLAAEYRQFEQLIGELFPQSNVRLLLIADKVIVKGEARDETEAMRILSVLRQANAENPASFVSTNGLAADFGPAARLTSVGGEQARSIGRLQLINMLHVASRPNDLVASPTTPMQPSTAAHPSTHDTIRSAKKP